MTREELIAYDRWLTENKWGSGEIISPEKAADLYLAENPLPPAEGAEAIVKKYEDEYDFKFHWVQRDRVIRMMHEFAAQQQPTAEGAEAFLRSHKISGADFVYTTGFENMVELLHEFATLHAQRLAEKMVSERNNTNYDMKPIEVTMDYAIKKLKKLIRVQRTCPQGHGKMKKTSFGPYWCLNCQKYYE